MACSGPCIACSAERHELEHSSLGRLFRRRIVFDRCARCAGTGWERHWLEGSRPCRDRGGKGRTR